MNRDQGRVRSGGERFTGRENEIKRLQQALERDDTRLLIVYGRRPCGKTTLLRHVLPPTCIYFAADLREEALQIAALANRSDDILPGFGKPVYPYGEGCRATGKFAPDRTASRRGVKNHVLDQHGILYKVIFLKRPEKSANDGSAMVISPEQVIRRSL